MFRKTIVLIIIAGFNAGLCNAQAFIKTGDLLSRPGSKGELTINQDQAIDTLISRHISSNRKYRTSDGRQGMPGFRIQIYYGSVRNAREEANKVMLQFLNKFGEKKAYLQYLDPGWYMVRVGNYRTRTEAYNDFMEIRKEFPDAYIVPAVIIFPDLIKD
ncbi:MAG: SPOR domain-containing protein [Bacteroidales bacterium]|nr:SPOR domain-containing protein [Bacteroidales bacterium]MBN2633969.1 SPOR domain-containing protein [Bacteroidales bacterium]